MADAVAAMSGVSITLLDAVSATTAVSIIVAPPISFTHHRLIIKSGAGVASGAIQPETSEDNTYTGTWAPVGGGPITVPAASSEIEYNWIGIYKFLKTRISTVIGGGTVSVIYEGGH